MWKFSTQSCRKLTTSNGPGQHFLSICLPKPLSLSCLIPQESTFLKLVTGVRKSLMEGIVLGLGLFWGFFPVLQNQHPTTCLGCSLLRLKEELDAHQRITSPSEHFRVSPYLCPGFRLGLCAWLHRALLLQRRKGKKCHSKQKFLQLQAEPGFT